MITPKLTAVMVAVTALIGAGPVAAFAQATNAQVIGDLTNAANVETGGNTQVNAAETTQVADNSIEISQEVESEAEAESSAEGGDAQSEAEAESVAVGIQNVEDNTFDNDVTQASTTTQVNALEDNDDVTVTQANVPVQTQEFPIAADIDFEGDVEALEALLELLGLGEEVPAGPEA